MITKAQFKKPQEDFGEPTHVITVRLPASMHRDLKRAAHYFETSMNQLCMASFAETLQQKKERESNEACEPVLMVRIAE